MNRKTLILVIVGILLVIAVIVAFVFSNRNTTNTNTVNTNTVSNVPLANISTNTNTEVPDTLSDEQRQKNEALRAASIFTEQYGTYNGGFNSSVLANLIPLVTDTYAVTLQKSVVASGAQDDDVSITTQVLNTSLTDFSAHTSAQVTVSTLRVQSAGADATPTQLSQDIVIREVYESGLWFVSSADWKTPKNIDSL